MISHKEMLGIVATEAVENYRNVEKPLIRDKAVRTAEKLYKEIESIQNDALYCGQVEQCEEAVRHEFVRRVADVIRNA